MYVQYDAKRYVIKQLKAFYYLEKSEEEKIYGIYDKVISELSYCFGYISNKYYHLPDGETLFNPLHMGQWTMFLYKLDYLLKQDDNSNTSLCDKLYCLNKCFSSADIFYEVKMPNIWFFDHPQGSVIGRAEYQDYFSFSQGCTVGNNKNKFPKFGKHVTMMSNSKILGDSNISDYVIFAANSYIIDTDIPSYSIVFGQSPNITIKSIDEDKFYELTSSIFMRK